jgi:hypothetical protein
MECEALNVTLIVRGKVFAEDKVLSEVKKYIIMMYPYSVDSKVEDGEFVRVVPKDELWIEGRRTMAKCLSLVSTTKDGKTRLKEGLRYLAALSLFLRRTVMKHCKHTPEEEDGLWLKTDVFRCKFDSLADDFEGWMQKEWTPCVGSLVKKLSYDLYERTAKDEDEDYFCSLQI